MDEWQIESKMPTSAMGEVSSPRRPAPPGRRPGTKRPGTTSFNIEDNSSPALSPTKPVEDKCVAASADSPSSQEGAEEHLSDKGTAVVAVEAQTSVLHPSPYAVSQVSPLCQAIFTCRWGSIYPCLSYTVVTLLSPLFCCASSRRMPRRSLRHRCT